jgi:hypothetical protein
MTAVRFGIAPSSIIHSMVTRGSPAEIAGIWRRQLSIVVSPAEHPAAHASCVTYERGCRFASAASGMLRAAGASNPDGGPNV